MYDGRSGDGGRGKKGIHLKFQVKMKIERVVYFCVEWEFCLANTYFKHKYTHKYAMEAR